MLSIQSPRKAIGRFGRLALAAALFCSLARLDSSALAQSSLSPLGVKGDLSMSTAGGFGRLVIRLDAEMDAEVRVSSGVLIVQFKQPVNVQMDRATNGASQYF